jgi:hypothetical protein
MLCDNWTKKMFVSACIFSDITNLRGGSVLKTMKDIYILTANAETNVTRPLLNNLPLSEPLCECIYIQPVATGLRTLLAAETFLVR